jgi:chromosome segregation ATPase
MAKELKIVKDDLDRVTRKLNTVEDTLAKIERERELDKIEKKQILDEKKRVDNRNRDLLKEKSKLIKEKNILEQLIASQGQQIEILTSSDKRQIHEISRLQGTVNSLENALKKYTDETQEIPDIDTIEGTSMNDNEVITPVVAMDLNIDDPEATNIIEVTPAEPSADNASKSNDSENKDEAA